MKILQRFAALNRKAMIDTILVGTRLAAVKAFTTIHNYIDMDAMILVRRAGILAGCLSLCRPIALADLAVVL
jgi:hypothetical protein